MTETTRLPAANDNVDRVGRARKAKTKSPKLGHLSRQLRALLTWRVISSPQGYTSVPMIEGLEEGERANLDCLTEVRPLPSEIMRGIGRNVVFRDVPQARLGGGGGTIKIAVGGDITRTTPERQDGRKPPVITRMGKILLSNGASEERCVVNKAGVVGTGRARVPLGGLVRVARYEPRDTFRKPKGAPIAANDNLTVRPSQTATPSAFNFSDPVAEQQHNEWVRQAVGDDAAAILDHALVAANLTEIGTRLGYTGKHAERRGRDALIGACKILEEKLAA